MCYDYHVKDGQQQGIMFFKAYWRVDEESGVVTLLPAYAEHAGRTVSNEVLLRVPMNEEALRILMNQVYLGENVPVHMRVGEDPVEETKMFLQQQQPKFWALLQLQGENNGKKVHPHTEEYREAVALERTRTAEALGIVAASSGKRKHNNTGAVEDDNVQAAAAPLPANAIKQKVRERVGPERRRAAHAANLRQQGQEQKENVRGAIRAIFACILQPKTTECARNETTPTSLTFVPVRNTDVLPPGVFSKNTRLQDEVWPTLEGCSEEQRQVCKNLVVGEIVYDLHGGSQLSKGAVVVSGDVHVPGSDGGGQKTQSIYDFMCNTTVQSLLRDELSQHFDSSGVAIRNAHHGRSPASSSASRGLSIEKMLALVLSWGGGGTK